MKLYTSEYQSIEILQSSNNQVFSCDILSFIDLTSLNSDDSNQSIKQFIEKINAIPHQFSGLSNPAAVCLYPNFISLLANTLTNCDVAKAVVAGNFPSSQTFIDVKIAEINQAIALGADEIDIVIPLGMVKDGEWSALFDEIKLLKSTCGDKKLKLILETGTLQKNELIWKCALLSLEAGADFIKTSTGKLPIGATPEAVAVMAQALLFFYNQTGEKRGIKISGGIATIEQAQQFISIVESILGREWITPNLFRIGASKLVNLIIQKHQQERGIEMNEPYF